MAEPRAVVAERKLRRAKDKVRAIDAQLAGARIEASRAVLECQAAGISRTAMAEIWGTNINQIDRMLAKAKAERH